MNCRLCFSTNLSPVPWPTPPNEPEFFRCADCGSDSAPTDYEAVCRQHYNTQNSIGHRTNGGGHESMMRHCSLNCIWFERAHVLGDEKTFLDVGSCDGSALDNLERQGWDVTGFDVLIPDDDRHRVITAPEFKANLFHRQFAAVLSREVFEHVPDPHDHLRQLAAACLLGGQVQVQTPRTGDHWSPHTYQTLHLFVASPEMLLRMLAEAGLTVIDRMLWDEGMAFLLRKS